MMQNFRAFLAAGCVMIFSLTNGMARGGEQVTVDKILATGPEWQEKFEKFQPESDMIEALKSKLDTGTKIDVYLGLWCKDSRNNVPLFIKIMKLAGGSSTVRYFDLAKKENKETPFFVEELQVDKVPTFIVFRNGAEIGRITENPKVGMLEDLMEIVFHPVP
jgi:hypothetical protein